MSKPATAPARSSRLPAARASNTRLGRGEWIAAARDAVIQGGLVAVKVDVIARRLGVTTGSFYWHFKDRQALLAEILADWEETNNRPLFDAVAGAGDDPERQFADLCMVWLEESAFSPAYDWAIRDWARTSPEVETAVRRIDDRRIELLHGIFRRLGNGEPEALVRARITYFHQVGYYTLQIDETRESRRALLPTYVDLLLGRRS
ncbi:MAG: TetR/AcrR family transcriptional regulator [Devosia sp.]|nr:TetR/AcrR family transcriptional regulator [Devosia sp.]